MSKSWEYYQQAEDGNTFRLYWICGLAGAKSPPTFTRLELRNDELFAIPFNQLKAVSVREVFFHLTTPSGPNGKASIGIYSNRSDSDTGPFHLLDQAEFPLTGTPGIKRMRLVAHLAADERYWAVFLANSNAAGAEIAGLGFWSPLIFWGATLNTTAPRLRVATGLRRINAFPSRWGLPGDISSFFRQGDISDGWVPCIGLAFSSVEPPLLATMREGRIATSTPTATFTPGGAMTGKLTSSPVYDGTYCAATASQDLGASDNTISITFTYRGAEAAGGVAVGVRWDHSGRRALSHSSTAAVTNSRSARWPAHGLLA